MTIVLAKLTAITVIKNHSQGIHEEEWHLCDLRKELRACGGIGSRLCPGEVNRPNNPVK